MVSTAPHNSNRGLSRLKDYVQTLRLVATPITRKAPVLYSIHPLENWFTAKSLYRNIGYWKDSPETLDEASEALAELVGEMAQLGPQDDILDVGFGFADQDLFWMRRFAPQSITGLNLTPVQVTIARGRVAEHGLEGRIRLFIGSATSMPFPASSFDKVTAIECAFHFVTRERFLGEAYRVLRPGGRIVIADPLPMPDYTIQSLGLRHRLILEGYRLFVPLPIENLYPGNVLAQKMQDVGFERIQVTSIRECVYPPYMDYLLRRLHDRDISERLNPFYRWAWLHTILTPERRERILGALDYVVAVGEKPA